MQENTRKTQKKNVNDSKTIIDEEWSMFKISEIFVLASYFANNSCFRKLILGKTFNDLEYILETNTYFRFKIKLNNKNELIVTIDKREFEEYSNNIDLLFKKRVKPQYNSFMAIFGKLIVCLYR